MRVVAWVEWDEAIKVSVSDIRLLVLDFNQVNRLRVADLMALLLLNPEVRPPTTSR